MGRCHAIHDGEADEAEEGDDSTTVKKEDVVASQSKASPEADTPPTANDQPAASSEGGFPWVPVVIAICVIAAIVAAMSD